MAAFMEASMAKGAPALTAPVKPLRKSSSRWCAARTACNARRLLQSEGGRLGTELVVGGVEVAADHARHDGAPAELDHPVLGTGVDRGAVRTVVMCRSSITTVLPGRAPSASRTVASRRTSLGTGAGDLVGSGHGSGTVLGHGGNDSDEKPMPAVARPGQAIFPGFDAPVTLGGSTRCCARAPSDRDHLPRSGWRGPGVRVYRAVAVGSRLPGRA